MVVVIELAHRQSPWTLDWVPRDVIGRGRGLFPEFPGGAEGVMTISLSGGLDGVRSARFGLERVQGLEQQGGRFLPNAVTDALESPPAHGWNQCGRPRRHLLVDGPGPFGGGDAHGTVDLGQP